MKTTTNGSTNDTTATAAMPTPRFTSSSRNERHAKRRGDRQYGAGVERRERGDALVQQTEDRRPCQHARAGDKVVVAEAPAAGGCRNDVADPRPLRSFR